MQPYNPDLLPLKTIDWERHVSLIGQANAALARYDGILLGIVNPQVLLSPLTTREAVLSSRIEGTQASLEEVLQYEADIGDPSRKKDIAYSSQIQDIHEIINYRKAMGAAVEEMASRPFSINTIRSLHRILLDGVRGRHKDPGELRRIQNYIAPPGTPIEEATFIPPSPEKIADALYNWEDYLYFTEKDPLVQLAILKAQFELIHPFLDGNGRIGRMLVPIILYHKKILSQPMFYISSYLERNRDVYYERLLAISRDGDWNGWISFFLDALRKQAKENSEKARDILELYNRMKIQFSDILSSKYSIQAVDAIFTRPIFKSKDFSRISRIPEKTTPRIVHELKEKEILIVIREGRGQTSAIYMFPELIDITER
ncbi:MAG: Fic family protein [Methanosarcinales archaeon]|nr:Fic family protein [Methanosarcinales archaeon]